MNIFKISSFLRVYAGFAIFCFICFTNSGVSAAPPVKQDTLSITINSAEEFFMKRNFQLLAARCGIDAADAQILQAKLYPNPNFSFSQGFYDQVTGKFFETNQNGEESAELSQLILLAGKRIKGVRLQNINKEITKDEFDDLIRSLHLEMNNSFSHLYFLLQDMQVIKNESQQLSKVIDAETILNGKGFVSSADLVRLKAQLISLQTDYYNSQKSVNDEQNTLGILLATGDSLFFKPVLNVDQTVQIKTDTISYGRIMSEAMQNRPDLKAKSDSMLFQQQYIKLQKSLAVPDLTLGASYDRRGSYITNFNALSVSFDLPVFNRNQGNIKQAQAFLKQAQYQYGGGTIQVRNDVSEAFKVLLLSSDQVKGISGQTQADYDKVMSGASDNFLKKNISLLEYLGYIDSYKTFIENIHQLQNNFIQNINQLNYSVGKTILKYE